MSTIQSGTAVAFVSSNPVYINNPPIPELFLAVQLGKNRSSARNTLSILGVADFRVAWPVMNGLPVPGSHVISNLIPPVCQLDA